MGNALARLVPSLRTSCLENHRRSELPSDSAILGAAYSSLSAVTRASISENRSVLYRQLVESNLVVSSLQLLATRMEQTMLVDAIFEFFQAYVCVVAGSMFANRALPLIFKVFGYYLTRPLDDFVSSTILDRVMCCVWSIASPEEIKANSALIGQYLLRPGHNPEFVLPLTLGTNAYLKNATGEERVKYAIDGMQHLSFLDWNFHFFRFNISHQLTDRWN
jgi:hypothetical protein